LIVPKDIQKFVGKTELRYSLKTGYIGVAKHKARFLAGQVQYLFQFLREGSIALSGISDEKIQQMVNRYIKDQIVYTRFSYSPLIESALAKFKDKKNLLPVNL
jgi:hypothetical protein